MGRVTRVLLCAAVLASALAVAGVAHADLIKGTDGDDRLVGTANVDVIRGFVGADVLQGGDGNDLVLPGSGSDTAFGDAGNDVLVSPGDKAAGDFIDCGPGKDVLFQRRKGNTIRKCESTVWIDQWIGGTSEADTLNGIDGKNDRIGSGGGADIVDGKSGNDLMQLAGGADVAQGGAGNDVIMAGIDNKVDTIDCGSGKDIAFVRPSDVTTNCETVNIIVVADETVSEDSGGNDSSDLDKRAGKVAICVRQYSGAVRYKLVSVAPKQLAKYQRDANNIIPAPVAGCPA